MRLVNGELVSNETINSKNRLITLHNLLAIWNLHLGEFFLIINFKLCALQICKSAFFIVRFVFCSKSFLEFAVVGLMVVGVKDRLDWRSIRTSCFSKKAGIWWKLADHIISPKLTLASCLLTGPGAKSLCQSRVSSNISCLRRLLHKKWLLPNYVVPKLKWICWLGGSQLMRLEPQTASLSGRSSLKWGQGGMSQALSCSQMCFTPLLNHASIVCKIRYKKASLLPKLAGIPFSWLPWVTTK